MEKARISREIVLRQIVLGIRLALGLLFLYSSVSKIRLPFDFLSTVYSHELVGPQLGLWVALLVPWLELLVGVCLLGGIFTGGALVASIGLGAMFVFVIGRALYLELDITCGCLGTETSKITYQTLVRAGAVLVTATMAYGAVLWQRVCLREPVQMTVR